MFPSLRSTFHLGQMAVSQAVLEAKERNVMCGFMLGASNFCIDFDEKN